MVGDDQENICQNEGERCSIADGNEAQNGCQGGDCRTADQLQNTGKGGEACKTHALDHQAVDQNDHMGDIKPDVGHEELTAHRQKMSAAFIQEQHAGRLAEEVDEEEHDDRPDRAQDHAAANSFMKPLQLAGTYILGAIDGHGAADGVENVDQQAEERVAGGDDGDTVGAEGVDESLHDGGTKTDHRGL